MSPRRNVGSGKKRLYPMMRDENSELRWSFILKIYSTIIFQLLLTVAVVYVVLFVPPPVANFFNNNIRDYVLYMPIVITFAFCSVHYYHQSYFLLLIATVCSAFYIGLICTLASGN
ncbi:hypothetical protein P8452_00220 [Trifolium repens]|nr:hypothetical protein P8452_00220 [Trifolium repens]